jgi:hypothetical protein
MDKKTRIKTLFVFLLFSILIGVLFLVSNDDKLFKVVTISLLTIYSSALIFGIYKTPAEYMLSDTALIIISRFSRTSINIKDIRTVRIMDSDDKRGLVRTFGAEGVIGNIGYYSSIKHKKMFVLTSRDTNWIMIETRDNKKVVISPDNLDLVIMLNKMINSNK